MEKGVLETLGNGKGTCFFSLESIGHAFFVLSASRKGNPVRVINLGLDCYLLYLNWVQWAYRVSAWIQYAIDKYIYIIPCTLSLSLNSTEELTFQVHANIIFLRLIILFIDFLYQKLIPSDSDGKRNSHQSTSGWSDLPYEIHWLSTKEPRNWNGPLNWVWP